MKNYSQIVTKVLTTPWMITPEALKMMLDILDAHQAGTLTPAQTQQLEFGDEETSMSRRIGNVGVINLFGPMFPKANLMTDMSGATSLEEFQSEFRSLMMDDNVNSILINVDSPGGSSDLVHETAMLVREAATFAKRVYSIANTAANSAAYYIASQAGKMYASPSAQVGSVGTFVVHTDDTGQREMLGLKDTVIKAGKFKAANLEPLTPESRAHIQNFVDEVNDQFIRSVAEGRKVSEETVREKFGEGGIVSPKYAVETGMIDGIATFDEVLAQLTPVGGAASHTNSGSTIVQTGYVVTTDSTANYPIPGSKQSYDADKEHSEPGTGLGGEPTPREPPEEGDPAIEGGWRRDPPPIAYEETEENAVNRTWLEERATALNVTYDDDMSDEQLAQAVADKMDDVIIPITAATEAVSKQREFEKDYPEQASKFAELVERDREASARSFAEEYSRFEGTNKGYSTLVRDKIAEAHAKVETKQFSQDDLKELLDLTAKKESVVEWGEQGSSREGESTILPTRNFAEDRRRFAELVRNAMSEDNLSQKAAIDHVAEQHPELAEAYLQGHAR